MERNKLIFRTATSADVDAIWLILQEAISRRKADGSTQWQDGYPNLDTVIEDIAQGWGFVLDNEGQVAVYCALILNNEPAYEAIEGKWLSNEDFFVVHRVAVAAKFTGKGFATAIFSRIEDYAKEHKVFSIKVDTNFDNPAMLKILENNGYVYCGQVYFRGSARKAFEKRLTGH